MDNIPGVSFPQIKSAFKNLRNAIKERISPYSQPYSNNQGTTSDDFTYNDNEEARSDEERLLAATVKSNRDNANLTLAELNRSGEIDSVYDKLLPEYAAFKNPEIKFTEFTPVSADTVIATV